MLVETFTIANMDYYPVFKEQDPVICENMCRTEKFFDKPSKKVTQLHVLMVSVVNFPGSGMT